MNKQELIQQIRKKSSFLCVGLDPDLNRIPQHLLAYEDPIYEFNKRIIDATKDYCVAYKPNIAFYECMGIQGWESLRKTLEYIPEEIFTIADAKRGDIGNTSKMYASTFFESFNFDSITISPYMGRDSVEPYFEFTKKWVILLGLTSNEGAEDVQLKKNDKGEFIFEEVVRSSKAWVDQDYTMYVVGATRGEYMKKMRDLVPEAFFLVPGVGAQGGSLEDVVKYCWNDDCGLLVNSSRGIIYADSGMKFESEVEKAAKDIQTKMSEILSDKKF